MRFRGIITATDLSPHLIDAGRRYAELEGIEGRITFEVSSAADLHAKNSTYDLIIAHTLFSRRVKPMSSRLAVGVTGADAGVG